MYSVYQHWDPLKVCIVGRSYGPEFYKFIENSRVRKVLERIAIETEEDYQKLITLLESFGVEVLRPVVTDDYKDFLLPNGTIIPPPMTPRDYSIMLGNRFFFQSYGVTLLKRLTEIEEEYSKYLIPQSTTDSWHGFTGVKSSWEKVINRVAETNPVYRGAVPSCFHQFNSAITTRVGKDIYDGTDYYGQDKTEALKLYQQSCPEYRWHIVDTGGHSDGTYCPVKPGLIVSLQDIPTYKDTFPGWEVVYLPGQSWGKVLKFLKLKQKNKGKWWVPGEELNDEFTDFVESWLSHWVGYVEETVFDVNMLIIDQHNVVCNNYNKDVFDAFERHGVTPHVINFRHRYFWDGGLHCITSDVHREGAMQDYFPERG